MKVSYYADDGTEFETLEECLEYEEKQSNARKNLKSHLYDKDGKEVPLDKIDYAETIDYFDIKTAEDHRFLWHELTENCGISIPNYVGQWYYDYRTDCWRKYKEYKDKYLIMKKIFEGE